MSKLDLLQYFPLRRKSVLAPLTRSTEPSEEERNPRVLQDYVLEAMLRWAKAEKAKIPVKILISPRDWKALHQLELLQMRTITLGQLGLGRIAGIPVDASPQVRPGEVVRIYEDRSAVRSTIGSLRRYEPFSVPDPPEVSHESPSLHPEGLTRSTNEEEG